MTGSITISRNDVEHVFRIASQRMDSDLGLDRVGGRAIMNALFDLGLVDADFKLTDLDSVSSATNGIEY